MLIEQRSDDTCSTSVHKSDYGTCLSFHQVYGVYMCFFMRKEKRRNIHMPRNQFQRIIFALLSVIFTVHGYVFYSLYVG